MNKVESVTFNSSFYKPVKWSEIVGDLGLHNTLLGSPSVLSQFGWVLLPQRYADYKSITVVTPDAIYLQEIAKLEQQEHTFLSDCGFNLFKMPKAQHLQMKNNEQYYTLCFSLIKEAVKQTHAILKYTYQHLDTREAEGRKLMQHGIIRQSMSETFSELQFVEKLVKHKDGHLNHLSTSVDQLLVILHEIARLSGGRALLQGNVIELMFHLFIFKNVYLTGSKALINIDKIYTKKQGMQPRADMPYINPARRYGQELFGFARFFRRLALSVDKQPDQLLEYVTHPAIQKLLRDDSSTAVERTLYLEAYAYGDPGVMMACPGPSLSGLMIRELGTQSQIDDFYQYLKNHHARTFFALTEPNKGSDAGKLECRLTPNHSLPGHYILNGEKCLFGNASKGKLGVILARTNEGPLGIRAVLITPELLESKQNYIVRKRLPSIGLRGAQIGWMRFNNCPIAPEQLLGQGKAPMERGMMAVIKTFNRLRTGVGALALGQAQAVLDYFYEHNSYFRVGQVNAYTQYYYQIEAARELLLEAAGQIDSSPFDSAKISVAKVQATTVAEKVIAGVIGMMEPDVLFENPWIAKCYRDCFSWEYMEGTRNMQFKNIFQYMQTQYMEKMSSSVVPIKKAS